MKKIVWHKDRRAWILALGSLTLALIACNSPGSNVAEIQPPEAMSTTAPAAVIEGTAGEEIQPPAPTEPPTQEPTQVLPAASATPTAGAILVLPSATPVPTLGLVVVADVVLDSGSNLTLAHDGYVDLETGDLNPRPATADFQMTSAQDLYLDVLIPMNGSYIGWYGAGPQPGKAGCNILMSASPMAINWPENEDTYYCYQTSNGHTGWIQVHTYVSMPIFERRLIFSFTTYE